MAPLQGLVEEMDQLDRVLGDDVLRLRIECVRDGDRYRYVLALIREIDGRTFSLARVLVRLEVVNNRMGVRFRLLLGAAGVGPRGWGFVFPLSPTTV